MIYFFIVVQLITVTNKSLRSQFTSSGLSGDFGFGNFLNCRLLGFYNLKSFFPDEALESRPDNSPESPLSASTTATTVTTSTTMPASLTTTATAKVTSPKTKPQNTKTTRWIVCPTFKELQRILKIPQGENSMCAVT